MNLPTAPACERNQGPIWEVLQNYLKSGDKVLEIGSGTGQHAAYMCTQNSGLIWQPTNLKEYIEDCEAWRKHTQNALISPCIELDVGQSPSPLTKKYNKVFTANTFHIMPWKMVEAFWQNLPRHLNEKPQVFVYGPFKYKGDFTSISNRNFDLGLKSRWGEHSGIRDFELIEKLAKQAGLVLLRDHSMPANNQLLVFGHAS